MSKLDALVEAYNKVQLNEQPQPTNAANPVLPGSELSGPVPVDITDLADLYLLVYGKNANSIQGLQAWSKISKQLIRDAATMLWTQARGKRGPVKNPSISN